VPEIDPAWVRAQFPALSREVLGRPAVFFDAPGGTQVPQRVIDAVARYYVETNANTGGAFVTSRASDATILAARGATADLLGCDADEVAFGANMTTLAFALARALAREIQPGDEVVVTRLDHDANVAPWRTLAEKGAVVREVDLCPRDCTLEMRDLRAQIGPRTRLVAVGLASNAVGTINDVELVARLARAHGALVFVDAVHYAPHGPLDVRALDCDFLACSAYKFFGPHLGILYGKREHLRRLRPYKVRPAPDAPPDAWETGTQCHEALAGLVASIDYLAELGRRAGSPGAVPGGSPAASGAAESTARRAALRVAMDAIRRRERALSERLIDGLLRVHGLTFYGIRDAARFGSRTPTVAVRHEARSPRALAEGLGRRGIFTWDGNYYALGLTERLGVEKSGGFLRIGLVHYNTADEIDSFLQALDEVARGRDD
jgi:cysteine desulfurase family protein (TIGR01976 family)